MPIHNHPRPRKRLGQHFLRDNNIVALIVKAIDPEYEDAMIEIGPGQGALTLQLLPKLRHLYAVELDEKLIPILQENCHGLGDLKVYRQDALTLDLALLYATYKKPLRIVGNLPYNISTPLLFHLLAQLPYVKDMHFLLQKEVVERMAASPGTKDYGRLSIMVQYHCSVEPLLKVMARAFYPPPKVESQLVRLRPRKLAIIANDQANFANLVKQAFNQRRKMLKNSLKDYIPLKQLLTMKLDNCRPEELTVEDFIRLSNLV